MTKKTTARASTGSSQDGKSNEVVETTYESAVPISSQTHAYIRANKLQVIIEFIWHEMDENDRPASLQGCLLVMNPDQFKFMTQHFLNMVDRLNSVETH